MCVQREQKLFVFDIQQKKMLKILRNFTNQITNVMGVHLHVVVGVETYTLMSFIKQESTAFLNASEADSSLV